LVLFGPEHVWFGPLGPGGDRCGVCGTNHLRLATRLQPLQGILADRLEHAKPDAPARVLFALDEVMVDQGFQCIEQENRCFGPPEGWSTMPRVE
jgi:hypothetical protein